MSYTIATLAPIAYSKKSKKTASFPDADNFVKVLHGKLDQWKFTHLLETKAGIAYKLTSNHFEKYFLSKCDIILFVVSASSAKSFQNAITRLSNTSQHGRTLDRVISISFDELGDSELNCHTNSMVNFGKYPWECEDENKWKELRNKIETTLQNIEVTKKDVTPHKSHSRLKALFHISSTKSESLNISPDTAKNNLPIIKVSKSHHANSNTISEQNDTKLRHQDDHTKLSSISIFNKISRRTRDSGLSMTSSTSTQSDTLCCNESKSLDVGFDANSEPSTTSEMSAEIYSSTMDKIKTRDRNTSHKALSSIVCFHSPQNNRKKKVKDALFSVAQFSSFLIQGSSAICIDNSKTTPFSSKQDQRCQSEPPMKNNESEPENVIKHFTWTSDMINNQRTKEFEEAQNEMEIEEIVLEPTDEDILNEIKVEDSYFIFHHRMEFQNEVEEVDFPSEDVISFDINQLTSSSDMESLNTSRDEREHNNRTLCSDERAKNTTKETINCSFYKDEIDELFTEEKNDKKPYLSMLSRDRERLTMFSMLQSLDEDVQQSTHQEISKTSEDKKNDTQSGVTSQYKEQHSQIAGNTFDSATDPYQSLIFQAGQAIVNNPIAVGCMLTVAALSAPIWSNYIPHSVDLGRTFYGAVEGILRNEMVQSIPNQLLSTARESTIVTASSLKGFLISGANNNILFHSY